MAAILSVAEARQILLSAVHPTETVVLPFDHALGKVLAEDIHSPIDWPPFTSSTMDGYAARREDMTGASAAQPATLNVVVDVPAGASPLVQLQPGQAARIMTGAPLPPGADTVVPIEDTDQMGHPPGDPISSKVKIFKAPSTGGFIRPAGQDFSAGRKLLQAGRRLLPQDIGLLATLGVTKVLVYRPPRVAILSTGDELLDPSQPLAPGKIRDSNTYSLGGLIAQAGAELIQLGTAPDAPEPIQEKLDEAVGSGTDLILTSAGVSVGAYDFVRSVIQTQGELSFWRVNMRPGKPIAFGHFRGTPVIGLPGNPVSSFIGFLVFARPVISKMSGSPDTEPKVGRASLAEPVESDGRESYLRAVYSQQGDHLQIRLTGHQGSGNLFSLVQANALLIIPSGVKSLPTGAEVAFWYLEN